MDERTKSHTRFLGLSMSYLLGIFKSRAFLLINALTLLIKLGKIRQGKLK